MMLSTTCQDAIRAIIYLTKKQENDFVSIKEIAENLGISFYFLSKILQKLVKAGILESYRGPNGGVKLARPPEEISLLEIIESIDGIEMFKTCILGFKECSDENPCAIHHKWAPEKEKIYEIFKNTNLSEIKETICKFTNIKI